MATKPDEARLRELYDLGFDDKRIAAQASCSPDIVYRWRKRNGLEANGGNYGRFSGQPLPPPTPDAAPSEPTFTETDTDGATVTSPVGRVMSLDELLDVTGVDRTVWEVERHVVNKWETGAVNRETGRVEVTELFQVKAWLKRNREATDLLALRDEVLEAIAEHAPHYPDYASPDTTGERFMLEVSPFDLHLGKLAWKPETGENYDSKIARRLLMAAVEDVVRKASGFNVECIVLPIGNDLMHTDTPENTTTAGTRQDVDSRQHKMFVAAYEVMVAAVDRLMQVAPVKVLVVPGNHDRANALKLGVVMDAHYRNTDRVTVDCGPDLRKYETYGVNLLGFTHGSEEKHADLPLIMAQERPTEWAKALHKEWHLGHLHKRKQQNYTAGDTHGGVPVRILPSLSGTDAWHYMRGYVKGQRAMEAYLWSYENGYAGHFSSNLHSRKAA